jgi:hypothetical protein
MTKRLINFYSCKEAQKYREVDEYYEEKQQEEDEVADSITGEARPFYEMISGDKEGEYLTEETFRKLYEIASLLGRSYISNTSLKNELASLLIYDQKENNIIDLQPVVDISGNWLHTIRQTDPSKVKKTIEGIMSSDKEMCVTDANEAPFWDFSNYRRFALVLSGTCRVLWNADVYSIEGYEGLSSPGGTIDHINKMTEGWITPNQCKFLGVIINDSEPVPEEVYSILEQEGIPILTHAEIATDHEYIDTKFYNKDDEYLDHFTCDVNDPESELDIPAADEYVYNQEYDWGEKDISDLFNSTKEVGYIELINIYSNEGMYEEVLNIIKGLEFYELKNLLTTKLPEQIIPYVFDHIINTPEVERLISFFLLYQPINSDFLEKYKDTILKDKSFLTSIVDNYRIKTETKLDFINSSLSENPDKERYLEKILHDGSVNNSITPEIFNKYKNLIVNNNYILVNIIELNSSALTEDDVKEILNLYRNDREKYWNFLVSFNHYYPISEQFLANNPDLITGDLLYNKNITRIPIKSLISLFSSSYTEFNNEWLAAHEQYYSPEEVTMLRKEINDMFW